jgi:protein gp37
VGSGTSISWTDATWNPIRGCRRTAPKGSKQSGCGDPTGGGCYAERQAARFCGPGGAYEGLITITKSGPRWSGKTRFVSEHLLDPVRWQKPRRIFTDSMSDLFYEGFRDDEIDRVVAVMMICATREGANHIFQTLTKRPDRMRQYFADPNTQERVARAAGTLMEDGDGWFDGIAFRKEGLVHPNLWWGVSVENQAAANERIPELLETPAAVRFLSCEPLLGAVDIAEYFDPCSVPCGEEPWAELHWVIAGCESGLRARECTAGWLRSLRDQCASANVPFFLKQAEESADCGEDRQLDIGDDDTIAFGDGSRLKARRPGGNHVIELPYLDGSQHADFPEVRRG